MAIFTVLSNKTYEAKRFDFSIGVPIPVGLSEVTIMAKRDNWPDSLDNVIDILIDISFDGGLTWIDGFIGFTARGGEVYDEFGQLMTYSFATCRLPQPENNNRLARGRMISKVPIKTELSIEVK